MLKFEFVVTGIELTDSQKERVSVDFPALVTKALEADGDAGRFWCMCKLNGRAMFAQEQPLPLTEAPCESNGSSVSVTFDENRPDVLVCDLV